MKLSDLQTEITAVQLPAVVVAAGQVRSDFSFSSYRCAAPLGGHRAVVAIDGVAHVCDPMNIDHASRVVGLSTSASSAGDVVNVAVGGVVSDPSLSLAPGAWVFVGIGGVPTCLIPPGVAFVSILGYALTPTSMLVSVHPSVFVEA